MKKKYAFYCSGRASRLIKYYQKYSQSEYDFEFIFYDGKDYVTEKLLINKFLNKVIIYKNKNNLKGRKLSTEISNIILKKLTEFKVDYMFCFGDKILKSPIIDVYVNRIINFHPSLLPYFPGLNAIDQALKSNVKKIGNTAHFIDKGIDTGPIIMQSEIKIEDYKTYDDVLDLQIPMLKEIWDSLNNDTLIVKDNIVSIEKK